VGVLLDVRCPACGRPGPAPCPGCAERLQPAPLLAPPPGVDGCAALLSYEGAGRALVTGLKYRNLRAVLARLAAALAALVDPTLLDAVTWAPTTRARRQERGFDQAELLARALAAATALPCRSLLRRGPGSPQTGRSRAERRAGPVFAPRARAPTRVLLVDDVQTTGATLAAAARALRAAGALEVWALTLAQTQPRRP
jgi:predicted amidophosphoribosyltransferase